MIKLIIFSILVAFSLIGKAQDIYYPFVDTTARWYLQEKVRINYDTPNEKIITTYKKFSLKKDTILAGLDLYKSYVDFLGYSETVSLDLFYEEDSVVYGVHPFNNYDSLDIRILFDFTQETEDNVEYNGYILSLYSKYTEAIGYSNGIFPNLEPFALYYDGEKPQWSVNNYWQMGIEFMCYERDGKIIYQNPSFSSCWPDDTTAIREIEDQYIVPSVLMGDVLVKTEGYDKLSLISVNGKVVLNEKLENAGLFELKTEELAPNMYWLILSDKNGNGIRQKVTVR